MAFFMLNGKCLTQHAECETVNDERAEVGLDVSGGYKVDIRGFLQLPMAFAVYVPCFRISPKVKKIAKK
jgi:hypothetical protein